MRSIAGIVARDARTVHPSGSGLLMTLHRTTRLSLAVAGLLATFIVVAPTSGATQAPDPTSTPSSTAVADQPTQTAPTSDELATVATLDSATGKVLAVWSGSQADRDQAIAAQKAQFGLSDTSAPQPAPDSPVASIVRHSPCTANTGYFEVWNYPPLVCYANSGVIATAIFSVYGFYTGNNVGGVHWICGGTTCNSGYWGKWATVLLSSPYPEVTQVYIQ
jgi:hypothetical protein